MCCSILKVLWRLLTINSKTKTSFVINHGLVHWGGGKKYILGRNTSWEYCVELPQLKWFAWIFEDGGFEVVGSLYVNLMKLTWSPFIAYFSGHFNTALAIFILRIIDNCIFSKKYPEKWSIKFRTIKFTLQINFWVYIHACENTNTMWGKLCIKVLICLNHSSKWEECKKDNVLCGM